MGSGPFPTEASGPESEKIRERGSEYGAVTGRPRRCGWFDVTAACYSARINDLRALIITKLDILDTLAEIPVGLEYRLDGKTLDEFPAEVEDLERVQVRYTMVPGWQTSTFGLKDEGKLPQRARDYLNFLAEHVGVEIAMVSTGPERDQVIWLDRSATEGTGVSPSRVSAPNSRGRPKVGRVRKIPHKSRSISALFPQPS